MRSHKNLTRAWRAIGASAKSSTSLYMREEAAEFLADERKQISSISARISHKSYKFQKARGVAAQKPGKPGKIRPIVISALPDRVVQRCILDALTAHDAIRSEAFQPRRFGGVPKADGNDYAGVEAAIRALLEAIGSGATHVMVADIEGFFTKIRKSSCINILDKYTDDVDFKSLFASAIAIDLDNSARLWRYKHLFPYGDIGVGQGNCLSPFLGNIILADFDRIMNRGDCVCIRYVDDIIIAAPSGAAASSRFREAERLLKALGMNFAPSKSSAIPIQVSKTFEYLGIEFCNELIRPAKKSRSSIERRVLEAVSESLVAMRQCVKAGDFDPKLSVPRIMSRISGMAKGWSHHYAFCNDIETIRNVDRALMTIFMSYVKRSEQLCSTKNHGVAAACLGYRGASEVQFRPLAFQPGKY